MLRLTGFTAIASAFINNTAIVAALLGTLARQRHLPPSRVLLPLSYAAILGGITTLIGTSTNLVVNALAVEAGLPPMGMFDLAWAGVTIAVVCLIVLASGSRHLPLHEGGSETQAQRYFLEARVMPGAPLVGRTLRNLDFRTMFDAGWSASAVAASNSRGSWGGSSCTPATAFCSPPARTLASTATSTATS